MRLQEEPIDRFTGNHKQQSPLSGTKNLSAILENVRFLWNQNVHYLFHKSTLLVSVINQLNPVHTLPSYCDEYNHLLGNGSLKQVLMSTKTQQKVSVDTRFNRQGFQGN
jgi:hypothetical protein